MAKKDKKTNDSTDAFSFDSLEEVHENIQDESSDPNLAAVEAASDTEVEKLATAQGTTDKSGTVFDAEIHAVDRDGNPSVTPLGKFRKKRNTSKISTTNKAILEQQATAQQKAAARAAGQLAADMLVGSAVTMLGEEWIPVGGDKDAAPVQFDEHSNLRRAFGDYFEAKGIHDFPPGIALSIAMTSYIMPRVAAGPETKSKLTKAKLWIATKWNDLNSKRKKKDATQSNSGNDGERKDDDSKADLQPKPETGTRHPRT